MERLLTLDVDPPMQFSWFAHPSVAIAEAALAEDPPALLADELPYVADAVPRRQREFAAGRACARRAMAVLGYPPAAVAVAADRTPVWPDGLVGSITHTVDHCAAAVGRKDHGIRSIGIDVEPADALDSDLVDEVCRQEEADWLSTQSEPSRLLFARAIFSAKEAAYKCQFALSHRSLEFGAVRIDLDLARHSFVATLIPEVPPFKAGDRIAGAFRISTTHIACAALLYRP